MLPCSAIWIRVCFIEAAFQGGDFRWLEDFGHRNPLAFSICLGWVLDLLQPQLPKEMMALGNEEYKKCDIEGLVIHWQFRDMNRRTFVKKAGLSMSSLTLFSIFSRCDTEVIPIETDKKIIVVGAGISGLAAAKYFRDRGVEVTVLEAQDKIGGRLRTDRSLGVAFDEGASWIHGPSDNPISDLVEAAEAPTFLTANDSVSVYDIDGSLYSDEVLAEAEASFNAIIESLSGDPSQSVEEVFYSQYPQYRDNRLWTYMLSAYLEFDKGGDIGELSVLDFCDDELFDGEDLILTDGYDHVAQYLAADLDIRLNMAVRTIDTSGDLVQLNTDASEFEADFVLVTVPLGVLKANTIEFTPALSADLQQAIDGLQMGSVNKYLCVWDAPFWDTELQYIGYSSEVKGKFNYFLNVNKFSDANALMTFTFGDYSEQAEGMSDEAVIEEIMGHLKAIYGEDIPYPSHMKRTRWVSNEYSYGAYSFASKGVRSSAFEEFEVPISNQLFFAGEHTARDYRGTVHGAYLSGVREAEKITDLL